VSCARTRKAGLMRLIKGNKIDAVREEAQKTCPFGVEAWEFSSPSMSTQQENSISHFFLNSDHY